MAVKYWIGPAKKRERKWKEKGNKREKEKQTPDSDERTDHLQLLVFLISGVHHGLLELDLRWLYYKMN